jgi:hypothetical protein
MTRLLVFLCTISLFGACKAQQNPGSIRQEKYTFREISNDSARIYINNYKEADQTFKQSFGEGMNIPMKVINELQQANGMGSIAIYYGRTPEFAGPVFILFQATETMQYKKSPNYNGPYAAQIYLVYYPCPTQCVPLP